MNKFSELIEGGTPQTQIKKRRTLTAICVTAVLIAAMLLFLAIFGIASLLAKNKKSDSKEDAASTVSVGTTFKTTISEDKLYSGSLLVLDGNHPYVGIPNLVNIQNHSDRPTHMVNNVEENIYTVYGQQNQNNLKATGSAITALDKMISAFYKAKGDDNIIIDAAYNESLITQSAIYSSGEAFRLTYFVTPVQGSFHNQAPIYEDTKYDWIYSNAHKYGFVSVGEAKSNVFRYVGIAHSTAMKQNKLSFDEYIQSVKKYTPDSALKVSASGENYAIYYLAKDSEHILPKDYEYTVSGNNVDGYIITVNLSRPASN